MNSTYAHESLSERTRTRSQVILFVGPVAVAAGVIWAILQPYRVTLLHPRGQSIWWLFAEPPLLVIAVGILFALVVARPLLADLEESGEATR